MHNAIGRQSAGRRAKRKSLHQTQADPTLIRERLMRSDPSEHEAIVAYKVHAYEGLVAQARAEVAWAQEGLRMVDELEAAGHREPDVAGSAR